MKKLLTQGLIGAAALISNGAANAVVMDFESGVDYTYAPFAPLLAGGDALLQGNFFANTQDVNGGSGLIANLSNAADPGSCLNGACPVNSAGQGTFLSVLNDGLVHFGSIDGTAVKLESLVAAFIPGVGVPTGSTFYLAIEGDRSSAPGDFSSMYFPLIGGTTGNAFQTIDVTQGGYRLGGSGSLSDSFTDIYVYGYFCNGSTGDCSAFTTNRAQFALDDITFNTLTAVPEPSEWLLITLGLGAIGAAVRRRRSI